jgi:hypothetical protein
MSDAPDEAVQKVFARMQEILAKDVGVHEAEMRELYEANKTDFGAAAKLLSADEASKARPALDAIQAAELAAKAAAAEPATTTATPVAASESGIAGAAAKEAEELARIHAKVDSELVDAITKGDKKAVEAIFREHPEHAEVMLKRLQSNHPKTLAHAVEHLHIHDIVADAKKFNEELTSAISKIEKLGTKEGAAVHEVEELLRGKNGRAILERLDDSHIAKLSEAGIKDPGALVKAGEELLVNVEKRTGEIHKALEEAGHAKPDSRVGKAAARELEEIAKKPGGAEALKQLAEKDSKAFEKVKAFAPNIDEIVRAGESFIKAQKDLAKLVVSSEEGLVVKEGKAAADLVRKHGKKLMDSLSAEQRAALHANPEVGAAIKEINKAAADFMEIIGRAKNGKLIEEDATAVKALIKDHGVHIMDAHGSNPDVTHVLGKTFGKEEAQTMIKAASNTGGEAAKGGEWFKKATGMLRWSEEALAKEATKSGKTVAELAKDGKELGKFRGSRLAMLGGGVAAITAMFVAGSGNSGPGERAASIQQQGLGAAAGQGLA